MSARVFVQRPLSALGASTVSALSGTYTQVQQFSLPSSASPGQTVTFTVVGQLVAQPPNWPNFSTGLFYDSGPDQSVTVNINGTDYNINAGSGIVLFINQYAVGDTITMQCSMTLTDQGTYQFSVLTGYYAPGAPYDDKVTQTITITSGGGGGGGSGGSGGGGGDGSSQMPWWWWIAALGGGAAIIAVAGVIAYQQTQSQQMLLLTLMSRRG